MMPGRVADEVPCVLCGGRVVAEARDDDRLICRRCTKRMLDRWGDRNNRLQVNEWVALHDLAGLCIFWHAALAPPGSCVPCDLCTALRVQYCNVRAPATHDDQDNIILGWCKAYGCCCDGNQVVDPRNAGDGLHFRCTMYRRREHLRARARLRFTTK